MRHVSALGLVALIGLACARDEAPLSEQGQLGGTVADDQPRPSGPNCEAFVASSTRLSTDWLLSDAPDGRCLNADAVPDVDAKGDPSHSMYADCSQLSNSPTQCDLRPGLQYCRGGRWTELCALSSDCREGLVCVADDGHVGDVPEGYHPRLGACERKCSTDLDCRRCDLACTPEGYCAPPVSLHPNEARVE